MIAGRELERANYFENHPLGHGLEIADIIGDHDTRNLPASDSGKIVRIADLLWRTTYPHAQIYFDNFSPHSILDRFRKTCISDELLPHLGKVGTSIAKIEFANMMYFKFRKGKSEKDSVKILESDYPKELEKVIKFYGGKHNFRNRN